MAQDVIMPQMGESIAEGTITQWLKNVGDKVERDEPLFEISTDKVDAEIPSPVAGILTEIKAQAGDTVAVDAVVAIIAEEGESVSDEPASAPTPAPIEDEKTVAVSTPDLSSAAPAEPSPDASGDATEVIMPQMGESIAEGTITQWLKNVGDSVERDEPLFEISTDKVDAEIPSPVAGTLLEIKAQSGETIAVDAVVALIGAAGAAATSAPTPSAEPSSAAEPAPVKSTPRPSTSAVPASTPAPSVQSVEGRRKQKSSPLVRKIAAEHGVDISNIAGTGLSGRVTKTDIMSFMKNGSPASSAAPSAPSAAPNSSAQSGGTSHFALARGEVPAGYGAKIFEGDTVEPLSNMRAKIAEHMVISKAISPHVNTVFDVDFTHVDALRKRYKAVWKEKHGVNLTFTAFIMKAALNAMKDFPSVNASIVDGNAVYHQNVNLGIAVALDWGLLVPVVERANELNLLGLARRTLDLATRARSKKLKPQEIQNGTFTITNPGIYGPLFGLPIINQPQVAIMGVGGVEKRPAVINDAIAIRTKCYLSLSFDHRLVDGATADQFMAKVKANLQDFDEAEL